MTKYEDEIDVEIPEGEDHEDWLYENEESLIEKHWMFDEAVGNVTSMLDYGYAGSGFIDEGE